MQSVNHVKQAGFCSRRSATCSTMNLILGRHGEPAKRTAKTTIQIWLLLIVYKNRWALRTTVTNPKFRDCNGVKELSTKSKKWIYITILSWLKCIKMVSFTGIHQWTHQVLLRQTSRILDRVTWKWWQLALGWRT